MIILIKTSIEESEMVQTDVNEVANDSNVKDKSRKSIIDMIEIRKGTENEKNQKQDFKKDT